MSWDTKIFCPPPPLSSLIQKMERLVVPQLKTPDLAFTRRSVPWLPSHFVSVSVSGQASVGVIMASIALATILVRAPATGGVEEAAATRGSRFLNAIRSALLIMSTVR